MPVSAYLNALMEEGSRERLLEEIAKLFAENEQLRATRPEALILKAVEVCKQIADECDARADADALDQRSHFWGGGARQCQHAVQALVSPLVECLDCGGTGLTPIGTCLRCGGTGELPQNSSLKEDR